jgi:hypothetical protein
MLRVGGQTFTDNIVATIERNGQQFGSNSKAFFSVAA